MNKIFLINASSSNKIMGRMGLTDIQLAKMIELDARFNGKGKPLTENMVKELIELERAHDNPTLPETCKTFLHEWYAGDNEEIFSKYMLKGEMVEDDLIDFAVNKLGYGIGEKNRVRVSDEYFTGECDVDLPEAVIDVKASWNRTTLHRQIIAGLDPDYKSQLEVYCHLYHKPLGVLFFGLLDTPPDANFGNEVIYSDIPEDERWLAYSVPANPKRIEEIIERVKICRAYLKSYDALIKSRIGLCV